MRVHACRFVKAQDAGLPQEVSEYGLLLIEDDATGERLTLAGDKDYVMMIERAAWHDASTGAGMHLPLKPNFRYQRPGWFGQWLDETPGWAVIRQE